MIRARYLVPALAFFFSACGPQSVGLTYAPASTPQAVGPATVVNVTTTDRRNEADQTWIGTIRGGYGNPLKTLHLPSPLSDAVTRSFRDALAARGMLAKEGQGRFDLAVTINELQGTQIARREAEVALAVELIDKATGRPVFHDQAHVDLVTGGLITLDAGIFASAQDLQTVIQNAMTQAIDQILNNPAFAAALRGGLNVNS